MKTHPAADVFPLMAEADLMGLAADIAEHGLLQPLVVHEGMILDGRNRFAACELAGVEPRYEEWDGKGSAVDFVMSMNLHRRHLKPGQRAAVGAKLLPLKETEAKERQREAGRRHGRGLASTEKVEPISARAGEAVAEAAKLAGSSPNSVKLGSKVKERSPATFAKLERGEVSISEAARAVNVTPGGGKNTTKTRGSVKSQKDSLPKSAGPLLSYLRGWSPALFDVFGMAEAKKRLTLVDEIMEALPPVRKELEWRANAAGVSTRFRGT